VVVPQNGTAEVRPLVGGRVVKVLVYEGEEVRQGQLLAELDTSDLVAELDRIELQYQALAGVAASGGSLPAAARPAAGELEMAQRELEEAEAQSEGVLALFERGAVAASVKEESLRRVDVARARYETAQAAARLSRGGDSRSPANRAQVQAAQAALHEARAHLEWSRIRAPISGVVLTRNIDPGDTLVLDRRANGLPLFEIADVSRVVVRTEIPENELHRVKPGQQVMIVAPGGTSTLALGRIARRAARLERSTLTHAGSVAKRRDAQVLNVFVELLDSSAPSLPVGQQVAANIDIRDLSDDQPQTSPDEPAAVASTR
jgi:multidrug resistance efflux pump